MWAPLSIRGLWSRSYLRCLQEPSLIQGVILNRCFSTRTPSGRGEERDVRGWDRPQSHFSGLILHPHCIKQTRLGHPGFGQNRGWNQGLPLGLQKCSFSCKHRSHPACVGFASRYGAGHRLLKFCAPSPPARCASPWLVLWA